MKIIGIQADVDRVTLESGLESEDFVDLDSDDLNDVIIHEATEEASALIGETINKTFANSVENIINDSGLDISMEVQFKEEMDEYAESTVKDICQSVLSDVFYVFGVDTTVYTPYTYHVSGGGSTNIPDPGYDETDYDETNSELDYSVTFGRPDFEVE